MSREKQNDEMAKIASKCMTKWLNNETPKALPDYIAEAFYNAGYRKQSDIIDEFAERLKKCLYDNPTIFTQQRYIVVDEINNLVAKMKGGAG